LLEDVYDAPMRLSRLLNRQGVSWKQLDRWRADTFWLKRFLENLEDKLLRLLTEALPTHDARVIVRWYGLDGFGARPCATIAEAVGATIEETQLAHDLFLRYLRRECGRAALEEAVGTAAREAATRTLFNR
jgi:hypothetical protein